ASTDNYYTAGTSLQLTAVPASGYQFSGFVGDVTGPSPQNLIMSSSRNVTATFSCQYLLSSQGITVDGGTNSGSFTVTTGATCPFTAFSDSSWLNITSGGSGPGS